MKKFYYILIGFLSSMFVITATDIETFTNPKALIKYIGLGLILGIIYMNIQIHDERITELENKIEEKK